jgi:hypothetical protein
MYETLLKDIKEKKDLEKERYGRQSLFIRTKNQYHKNEISQISL